MPRSYGQLSRSTRLQKVSKDPYVKTPLQKSTLEIIFSDTFYIHNLFYYGLSLFLLLGQFALKFSISFVLQKEEQMEHCCHEYTDKEQVQSFLILQLQLFSHVGENG